MKKPKFRVGWVGFSDGEPFTERVYDDYVAVKGQAPLSLMVYFSQSEARKRFEDVRRVSLIVRPLTTHKKGK